MGIAESLSAYIKKLLGVSAYELPNKGYGPQLGSGQVERVRHAIGGQIQPLPNTRLRWYAKDLEDAQRGADAGYLETAAQLYASMRRDGVLKGLLHSRTSSLIRLPRRFYGNPKVADALRARNGTRSVFDEMFPPSELALLQADGVVLGVGVAEMVPVPGRDYPVMVRLEPEFLQYRWVENRWYFASMAGLLPITPGDGRWILHVPGGRLTPWRSGLWPALGRSFINKEHAINHRMNYSAKLANPARVAVSPSGATEEQRQSFFRRLMAWAQNTVFALPVGWDVKLIESNGRGFDVFQKEIDTSDMEYMIAIAGQLVTTTGGTGFANAEVPEAIRHDLVQADGEALAYTLNTQGIPQFAAQMFGEEGIDNPALVEWDTSTPSDRDKESRILLQVATALQNLTESFAAYGSNIDVNELAVRYQIPLLNPAEPASEVAKKRQEEGLEPRTGLLPEKTGDEMSSSGEAVQESKEDAKEAK